MKDTSPSLSALFLYFPSADHISSSSYHYYVAIAIQMRIGYINDVNCSHCKIGLSNQGYISPE